MATRRGTILIIAGIILAIGTAAIAFILLQTGGQEPTPPPQATPEEEPTITVVRAAQEIPAYSEITADAVVTWEVPYSALADQPGLMEDPQDVIGQRAIRTIRRTEFITADLLFDESRLLELGYDASLNIPPGRVAMAFQTTRLAAVAGAVQSGDFVDLLISYWLVDTEQEVGEPAEGEGGEEETYILLAQLMLQDVEVYRVGAWGIPLPEREVEEEAPEEEGAPAEEQGPEEEEAPEEAPLPPPAEAKVMLTLLLDQQDALVLKFARESGATIDLVLRGREDHNEVRTETVSIEYIMTRFDITVPPEPLRFVPTDYRH